MAEKPKSEKKKEGKEEEKIISIPLRHTADKSAKNMRMNRSIREIKHFLSRHMKVDASSVSVSQQLNESLWKGGFHKPPASIKVKVSKDDEGNVNAQLIDEKQKPKKERKSRLGLRERLARRKEESTKEEKSKEEKPEAKKEDKPAKPEHKVEEKTPEHKKESEEIEQHILPEE